MRTNAPKPGRVLAEKGARHVYQVVTNTKAQITVMVGFNAYGDYAPPMILFPGERLRDVGLSGFPAATYAVIKNGWMDSDTFVELLKSLYSFGKSQNIQFPILLFVDGHQLTLVCQQQSMVRIMGLFFTDFYRIQSTFFKM